MSECTGHCNGDAVPIKVHRVFDSCSDKDCISNVPVTLTTELPASVTIVKSRCVTVADVCINVEEIPFNKGFYSVDITFSLDVQLVGYEQACGEPIILNGTAAVSKNCILYGSEASTKTFYSDGTSVGTTGDCCNTVNPPTAAVQVVSPIVLEAKIGTPCQCYDCSVCCECADGNAPTPIQARQIYLTFGLFYVVELTRPVTIMVPTYNYTIPKKECCADVGSPCEIFDKIKFPTEAFSPSRFDASDCDCGCNCAYPSDRYVNTNDCSDCQDI